jgi:hypothetical protein
MSDRDVRSLPVGERAEVVALARRLLEILPAPSHARDLENAMLDMLERASSSAVTCTG